MCIGRELYEIDMTWRLIGIMKKQIQLYSDSEDEMHKILISAINITYLLDVCYKFSVEFYKWQMKEGDMDPEDVIWYLIAMMYLLKQGRSFSKAASGRARGTGKWLWGWTHQLAGYLNDFWEKPDHVYTGKINKAAIRSIRIGVFSVIPTISMVLVNKCVGTVNECQKTVACKHPKHGNQHIY